MGAKKYTKEMLEAVIMISITWAEVCRSLGLKANTGAQTHIKERAVYFKIDYSHFLGQAHARGKKFKNKNAIELCKNGVHVPSHRLKIKLIKDGYKQAKCEFCGIQEWMGEPVVLELDHIDSDHFNNELSNLQILCPNCHALMTRKRRKMPQC